MDAAIVPHHRLFDHAVVDAVALCQQIEQRVPGRQFQHRGQVAAGQMQIHQGALGTGFGNRNRQIGRQHVGVHSVRSGQHGDEAAFRRIHRSVCREPSHQSRQFLAKIRLDVQQVTRPGPEQFQHRLRFFDGRDHDQFAVTPAAEGANPFQMTRLQTGHGKEDDLACRQRLQGIVVVADGDADHLMRRTFHAQLTKFLHQPVGHFVAFVDDPNVVHGAS